MEVINNKAFDSVFVVIFCASVTLTGETIFADNVGSLTALASYVLMNGRATFINNTVPSLDNINRGGALTSYYFSLLLFINGTAGFINNRANLGGAAFAVESAFNVFAPLYIANNTAVTFGGGVYLYHTPLYVYVFMPQVHQSL